MGFLRTAREDEWRRLHPLGRRNYIWRRHVLPLGVPIGVMIAVERFAQLGMSWGKLLTWTGVAIAYFSYPRAREVLDLAELRFGKVAEIDFWRLHFKDRVLGETMPNEIYERLASHGSSSAYVALFAASQRLEYGREARRVMNEAKVGDTARKRYLLSFA